MKMLFVINNEEKTLKALVNKFNLPFNTITYGTGTASQGILDFLNLVPTCKNVLMSIVSNDLENNIIEYLKDKHHLNEINNGILFSISLTSASKYVLDSFKERDNVLMDKKMCEYNLLVVIANDGNYDSIMNIAKKNGANGGTLLKGRSIGGKSSLKFFNMTIEPEKDILLIVCKSENKNQIMKSILEKNGINTNAGGMCFSLPIDNVVGIVE